jgi:hypothetical protein
MKNSKTKVTMSNTKTCNRCPEGTGPQPIANFRIHKSGYVLGQCKACEREASKSRRVTKGTPSTFEVSTPSGKTFKASLTPVTGSRKVTHEGTTKVIYVLGASRDEVRSVFAKYANVSRNRVKSSQVD